MCQIVMWTQTLSDNDRRRIGKIEIGSTFPIDANCRRQSTITTCLFEHARSAIVCHEIMSHNANKMRKI
jgi:hypothetical protein